MRALLLSTLAACALQARCAFHCGSPAPRSAARSPAAARCCLLPQAEAELAASTVERWIREFVVDLGLCPYASRPLAQRQIRYVAVDAETDVELLQEVYVEGQLLLDEDEEELATTMLIAPRYGLGIERFYALYESLTDALEDEGEEVLRNRVQPAFFHPEWTFSGLEPEAPIHFEKRAPFPVVNLLRRAQLDRVVEEGLAKGVVVNAEIAAHNAATLEEAGYAALRDLFERRLSVDLG